MALNAHINITKILLIAGVAAAAVWVWKNRNSLGTQVWNTMTGWV